MGWPLWEWSACRLLLVGCATLYGAFLLRAAARVSQKGALEEGAAALSAGGRKSRPYVLDLGHKKALGTGGNKGGSAHAAHKVRAYNTHTRRADEVAVPKQPATSSGGSLARYRVGTRTGSRARTTSQRFVHSGFSVVHLGYFECHVDDDDDDDDVHVQSSPRVAFVAGRFESAQN